LGCIAPECRRGYGPASNQTAEVKLSKGRH